MAYYSKIQNNYSAILAVLVIVKLITFAKTTHE